MRNNDKVIKKKQLVLDLLPVMDNLDRCLESSRASEHASLREGVSIVRDQFQQVLEGVGVTGIDADGETFDPAKHEAVMVQSVENPADHKKVIAVLRRGYLQDGHLLRAAQVVVGDAAVTRPDERVSRPSKETKARAVDAA